MKKGLGAVEIGKNACMIGFLFETDKKVIVCGVYAVTSLSDVTVKEIDDYLERVNLCEIHQRMFKRSKKDDFPTSYCKTITCRDI